MGIGDFLRELRVGRPAYVQLVRHADIARFEARGWTVSSNHGGRHHGHYGVIMIAPAGFEPAPPHVPGQRTLARGFERPLPPNKSRPPGDVIPACEHVWTGAPAGAIVCGRCGTRWDEKSPHYVDHIKLVKT